MVATPASEKPRFRQDLVAEPVEDGATRFIDVADPDTGNLFRFFEVEYSLACAMDGSRDTAGIVQWAKEELGLATSPKEVQLVISTLRDLGYLEGGAAAAAAAQPAHIEQPRAAVVPAGVKPTAKPAVNKWDAPTQMGDADDYLEAGVVAAKPAAVKHPAAEDLELGNAGTTPAKVEVEIPRAPELELGAPGITAAAAKAAQAPKVSDVALGTAGRVDVSSDLADHMGVSAADVKEAVRQSQVMKAVDVPKELLESVEPTVTTAPEPKKPEPKVEAKKPEPKVEAKKPEPKVEAKKPEPKVEAKKPEPKVEKRPAVAAKEPPKEEKRPVVPPAPKSGASPILIAFLVLAVLGAGAFFAYKYVFKKKDAGTQATTTPPPVQPQPPPEPPPPPPVESQKLATEQQDPVELKATAGGQLDWIVANDTAVKAGDPVATLAGHKLIETEIAAIQKDIDTRVKPELDKATKDHDAARIADRQKSLNDKQAKLDAKKAELGKLQIKAPADGKVTAVAKANTKIAANDVVAKLTKAPVLAATFKTASGVTPQSRILLAVKGGDQKVSCTVVTADASGVKVACPAGGATDGAEVTFVGPDPSAPAQGSAAEIDMNDEGSAAKAPEAGSAAPGSAAATPADKPAAPPVPPPAPKASAKAPAKAPAHAAPKAPAKPAGSATDTPADKPPEAPADKPAEPAPAPAPAGGDTLK